MPGLELPIAVLRYTWKGDPPHPPDWQDAAFNKLFISPGWPWGLPKFWSDSTLGRVDLATRARVFPWRELSLDHALIPDPQNPGTVKCNHQRAEVYKAGLDDAGSEFDIEKFGVVVVFVDPGPSPAGGIISLNGAVLDWNAPQSYYAQEIGHALLLQHSGDMFGVDYGDPYCVMSALTSTYMFSLTGAPPDPDMPIAFWANMGSLASAAEVRHWLRNTSSVVELPADARDQRQLVTLRAFTTASFGDPVLASLEVDGETWTAEYRVSTGWDDALPSKALVIHKTRFPPNPGQSATTLFMGAIPIPFDRGMDSWQDPLGADINVVVSYADDERVTFRFRHRRAHDVDLQEERIRLATFRGPKQRKQFPVWNGLCGDAEFDYHFERCKERIKLKATPSGYNNPVFRWKLNDQPLTPGSPVTVSTTRYLDDGIRVTKKAATVSIVTRTTDDAAPPKPLPANELWLENSPSDGTFELVIEVNVDEQPSAPPPAVASAWDQFEGERISIDGKAEADAKCRQYWASVGTKLPKSELRKFIDKGDPVWRILEQRSLPEEERDEFAQLVALARALRSSEPERSREIAYALARRLEVPQDVIARVPG